MRCAFAGVRFPDMPCAVRLCTDLMLAQILAGVRFPRLVHCWLAHIARCQQRKHQILFAGVRFP